MYQLNGNQINIPFFLITHTRHSFIVIYVDETDGHFSAYDFYEHESNAGKLQRQFRQIHIMHETLRHTISVEMLKKRVESLLCLFKGRLLASRKFLSCFTS